MIVKRRFSGATWATGAAGLLVPLIAAAFNLGEADIRSNLGQPLDIAIPVELHRTDAPGDYLRVEFASWQDYVDAGIEEVFDRQDARIELLEAPDGTPLIHLRTLGPVREPIVPILLDARLGNVMVRREYSILLDPTPAALARGPRSQPDAGSPVPTITTMALPESRVPRRPSAPKRPLPAIAPAPEPPPNRRVPLSTVTVVVQPGETLGGFSQRVRRNPATPLNRMMRDIYVANPHAFGGNPDLLWAGSELRIPLEKGVNQSEYRSATPARAQAAAPTVMILHRTAGKLITSLTGYGPPKVFASLLQSRTWMPDARFPATQLSVVLADIPAGGIETPSAPRRVVERAGESVIATELDASLATAMRSTEPAAGSAEAAPTEAAPTEAAPTEAAPTEAAPTAVSPTEVSGESGGFWRNTVGFTLLFILAWLIWGRRREGPANFRQTPRGAEPMLPPVSKRILPVELQPGSKADAQAESNILAAAEPRPTQDLSAAKPDPAPDTSATKPHPMHDFSAADPDPAHDVAANEAETKQPYEAAAANEEPLEFVMDGTDATPAVKPKAPPPKEAKPTSKIVKLPGAHRHNELIEVDEKHLPETTGGLSGFYADVAQMLTTSLVDNPNRRDLRLKLLEVYFAAGMADEFLKNTREYLELLRGQQDEYWPEIAEMGRQLFPQHEWFVLGAPPVLGGAKKADSEKIKAQQNFNRYYEGVDQWKLRGALEELTREYKRLSRDPEFMTLRQDLLQSHAGRPSPLVHAAALSAAEGGAQVYLKREPRHGNGHDHLINAVGQIALAKRMGRRRIITATTNGLHGLAAAVIAKAQKLDCTIHMDEGDAKANHSRVLRMKEFGAVIEEVHDNPNVPDVDSRGVAMTAWLDDVAGSLYVSSLASGPHPYPMIMHENLALVGIEAREQMRARSQRPPTAVITGITDGPAAIGIMQAFLDDTQTRLYCTDIPHTPAKFTDRLVGSPYGTVREHDWPREHTWLRDSRRVQYGAVTDLEANNATTAMYEHERLMLSRDGSQVVAYALRVARELTPDHAVIVLLPAQNDADQHFVESKLESESGSSLSRA